MRTIVQLYKEATLRRKKRRLDPRDANTHGPPFADSATEATTPQDIAGFSGGTDSSIAHGANRAGGQTGVATDAGSYGVQ